VNAHHTEKQPSSQSFSGIFPVQKERGETLAVLLERFRSEYTLDDTTKLTYAGRLDPMAEGLVLVLAGESRFQKDTLLGLAKEYEIEVLFGIATDTLDPLGVITETNITPVAEADIQNAIEKMKQLTALPYPLYSSVPVEGKALFVHARQGKKVSVPEKKITVFEATLLSVRTETLGILGKQVSIDIKKVVGDFRQDESIQGWEQFLKEDTEATIATIRICASSGTYMRSLAEWLGKECGVPALAYRIKRVKVGEYK
jgi:tRNA pseudouridine55 synthase